LITSQVLQAIEASDADVLLRSIDGLCKSQSWSDLEELRHRCREAVGRGKQVWGVEEHIRYRLALEAPAELAGPVVSEGQARFALGPLAEVAASTKTWAEMEPHLEQGPERMTFAAERVVRGEAIDLDSLELPGTLFSWEPDYPLATYHKDRVEALSPSVPTTVETGLPSGFDAIDDLPSESALGELVLPWTDQSSGRCQVTVVDGDRLTAIRALGASQAAIGDLTPREAMAWMSWAAASGGAHGRRRGAAAGRYLAWWVTTVLADVEWPAAPEDVGKAAEAFRWSWFDDGSPATGWAIRLAIEDPEEGVAWALSANDSE
jgi:hypothetical protein